MAKRYKTQHKHVTITLMSGISASGKTTRSRKLAEETGAAIISRDILREQYFPHGEKRIGFPHQENFVTYREHQLITHYMLMGQDVIIDDNNINNHFVRSLVNYILSVKEKYEIPTEIKFEFTYNGELEECVQRNRARIDKVPEEALQRQHKTWFDSRATIRVINDQLQDGSYDPYIDKDKVVPAVDFEVEPYKPDTTKPTCIISDIDGTVARAVERNVYWTGGVETDHPIMGTINLLKMLAKQTKIIFVSGRKDICREETLKWLQRYFPDMEIELFMRDGADSRCDDIVKYEIFNEHFRYNYNVLGWFDDRHRVSRVVQELKVPLFFVGDLDYEF